MTTQTWDNRALSQDFPNCRTLSQIIEKLEAHFNGSGEVICEIRVDGLLLDEGDEKRYGESNTRQIQMLEVRANRPDDLIRDAIASTLVFIPDLTTASLDAAEKLRGSEVKEGLRAFGDVIQGCQWFVDTLMHVRGAAAGTSKPITHVERWYEAEKFIGQVVTELNAAYGGNDSVLLADLLEYELTGAIEIWKEVIENERR